MERNRAIRGSGINDLANFWRRYVMLLFWPLTLWLWTFAVYRGSSDRTSVIELSTK